MIWFTNFKSSTAEKIHELTGGIAFQELCVQHKQATLKTS